MQTHDSEIGYVLKGYPRTSETFITNEIYLLEQAGLRLSIFSLKTLEGQQRHGVVGKINAPVTYLPETTPQEESGLLRWLRLNLPNFAESHWRLLRRRPAAYFGTLAEALRMSLKYRARAFVKEFLQAGFIALKVLESGRIRHLHAHFCHTSTTVTMLAARLAGVPFSFTAHAKDIYREDMNPGDLLPVKLRRVRFAVTCTGANQLYLDKLRPPQTPLHRIYHGLDLSLFSGRGEQAVDAKPLILSVGRMVEKKGFPYLVEACRLLKDEGYDFTCRIVGGADQATEAIKRAIERCNLQQVVSLHSAVTQEELRRIYEQATVFALPCQVMDDGDRDGIPNVLVEAMAMQLPVVSTRISGIPELIEDRANGLLIPQKDAQALAAALKTLLDDAALRERLGRAAREKVCRDFDAKRNILALKSLFPGSAASPACESGEDAFRK
ncbi:MAG TPA: glycosyltransferase family 4 protein [Blastocatellia bacterium]|nr:glycosyltransferase family 4 protein [Blastocatellia bacterium]HMZ17028.1 glycosyltransferase family 4 protein [Blastocatellia bacterium]HNG33030.1 glycosyltransferase family 4 protein [Blastocatellia bacterium]